MALNFRAKLQRLSARGLVSEGRGEPLPTEPVAPPPAEVGHKPAATGQNSGGLPDAAPSFLPALGLEATETRMDRVQRHLEVMRHRRSPSSSLPPTAAGGAWQGMVRQTPHGPLCTVHRVHSSQFAQGRVAVTDCLLATPECLMRLSLDPQLAGVDPRRLLFVDTETTGLAGGSGTVPFLVGVAYFRAEKLHVEQWMLQRLGEEGPILRRFAECLAQADAIVTYNGKCFDWPLLRNRFVLNRIEVPPPLPHLDLLHCTRRILRRRKVAVGHTGRPSMRLGNVEQALLGFFRADDISSAQIPELYFSYLRGHGAHLLDPVLLHNRHDLVSLAALLGVLAQRLNDVKAPHDSADHLAMAELHVRGGATLRALEFAQAAGAGNSVSVRVEACLLAAQIRLRQKQWAQAAAALWCGLPAASFKSECPAYAPLHLSLAKLFEHRLHDLDRALYHATWTLPVEAGKAQARRVERLKRKLLGVKRVARVPVPLSGNAVDAIAGSSAAVLFLP